MKYRLYRPIASQKLIAAVCPYRFVCQHTPDSTGSTTIDCDGFTLLPLKGKGLLHRGDRKFASAKSSVTDSSSSSSSRNFQYLTKKSRQQNYLAILTRKELSLRPYNIHIC
ncbi:PREDICTED: uncharacterized protein LOC105451986 [Wasmannia auropunctata]|uniref:uncharacterized protein LOC105451986 n=1 Tax=Wasmannia auropunctata TaxID=64793 RepID=UPI0005EE80E2|nr:PREDICTED: uncharacterized protein LOC105451986 [Wasmannia auropunctata]